MNLNVLVIGSGGREDALCWKISQSNLLGELYCIPGNPGTGRWAKNFLISINDFESIKNFCIEKKVDLVVVGPELPLVTGIEDYLSQFGIKIFGPSKSAAMIEGSKSFAKELMIKKNVPTAKFKKFSIDEIEDAKKFLLNANYPIVLKVDGLAGGKGVTICDNYNSSIKVLEEIFINKKFGDSGNIIVVEEFLDGEEFSVFAVTDGYNYVLLTPAQDYKRIGDNDTGKNTGGMGSYAFNNLLNQTQIEEIKKNIIEPTLEGLREINSPYKGVLYCGLIQTINGIKVIEFNCRFGDPETQSVLTTLNSDFLDLLWKTVNGDLSEVKLEIDGKAICLVLASEGYPDEFEKGFEITGIYDLENKDDLIIFHAGTIFKDNKLLTNGGRVLNVVSYSREKNFSDLIKNVYDAAEKINFKNKYYRKDIGLKALRKIDSQLF